MRKTKLNSKENIKGVQKKPFKSITYKTRDDVFVDYNGSIICKKHGKIWQEGDVYEELGGKACKECFTQIEPKLEQKTIDPMTFYDEMKIGTSESIGIGSSIFYPKVILPKGLDIKVSGGGGGGPISLDIKDGWVTNINYE